MSIVACVVCLNNGKTTHTNNESKFVTVFLFLTAINWAEPRHVQSHPSVAEPAIKSINSVDTILHCTFQFYSTANKMLNTSMNKYTVCVYIYTYIIHIHSKFQVCIHMFIYIYIIYIYI